MYFRIKYRLASANELNARAAFWPGRDSEPWRSPQVLDDPKRMLPTSPRSRAALVDLLLVVRERPVEERRLYGYRRCSYSLWSL
jgi:hypothetical protein